MTKAVTYKFIKGQGWVAGYWEERKWVLSSMDEHVRDSWVRAARAWHDPIAGRQVPRREPRQVAPQDYGVLLSEPIRTMRTAPPRDRYIVDDPTTAFREAAALWARALDDE